ncbi:hypothetical protein [Salinimicrobium sp. TH3]|uniref:hypothetical protein n=1 Tax=Salinimicrobium sp. TH3 TaxID=2997342 RepID=UPI002273096C|nr:hypothetical protein [Salinimicrobium sp. TH3]MCY2687948.1 hypothetical protein [Salinimicrobium sp. TH3]
MMSRTISLKEGAAKTFSVVDVDNEIQQDSAASVSEDLKILKMGVWAFFILLIIEGGLRKWVLPGLATPLLIVRDPLAIWMIYKAIQKGIWTPGAYVIIMWFVTILSLAVTFIFGHGNFLVAFYGFRITVLLFPVIFIIGAVFNKNDVIKMGKVMLWITIAMTILVAFQFYSPQSAWVNRGVGGDLSGSGFSGAAGFLRVPGTFSFTNGLSLFYGLAAAYIFYFWIAEGKKNVSKLLLAFASFSLLAAIPLSISRAVVFQIALSLVFMMGVTLRNPGKVKNIIGFASIGILLFLLIGNFSFFETASKALTERFTTANTTEGGMVEGVFIDRFLGGMFSAISNESFAFWGGGLGMGTSVGAEVLAGGRGVYLIGEDEWARIMGEMGLIFGLIVIFVRVGLAMDLLKRAWDNLSYSNILPWMLISFGLMNILQGQWSQPTNLGFVVLVAGLIIASTNHEISH